MSDTTTGLIIQGEHLNRQFVERLDLLSLRRMNTHFIKTIPETVRLRTKEVIGKLIVGHSIYGEVGKFRIGQSNFILDHPIYGLLSSGNYLVDGNIEDEYEIERVINQNNTFNERFLHTDFIDADESTGSLSSKTYSLDDGEILQSEIIQKDEEVYTKAKITITSDDLTNLNIYISADGGTTWEETSNETFHTFSTTTEDGIKYKIENSESSTIDITKVKIEII